MWKNRVLWYQTILLLAFLCLLTFGVFAGVCERSLTQTPALLSEENIAIESSLPEWTPPSTAEEAPAAPVPDEASTEDSTAQSVEAPSESAEEMAPETPAPKSALRATLLSPSSIVVLSFAELSDALSSDNGFTEIYIGANFVLAGPITIHPSKKTLVIDGIDPGDPGQMVHTLTESSAKYADTVTIASNTGTKYLTIRNLNMIGVSTYGLFSVDPAVQNVSMVFENVTYRGPRMVYNNYGSLSCTNLSATVQTAGEVVGSDVVSCSNLTLSGNISITLNNGTRCFYFYQPNGSISILPNANVTVNANTGALFSMRNDYNPSMTVGENAKVNISTLRGMTGFGMRLTGLFIHRNAEFYFLQSGTDPTKPVIAMAGNLTVDEGAVFHVRASVSVDPLIVFTADACVASFHNPRSVLLNDFGARVLKWDVATTIGYVNILAENINYWQEPSPKGADPSLDNQPLYRWRKANGGLFSMQITINGGGNTITALNSNYEPGDGPAPPSAGNFLLSSAKELAWGETALTANPIAESDTVCTGTTNPGAAVRVSFVINSQSYVAGAIADPNGNYAVALPVRIPAGTIVTVKAIRQFISRQETALAVLAENYLSIDEMPSQMQFMTQEIADDGQRIARQDPNWRIVIDDDRLSGGTWKLYAQLVQPLTTDPPGIALSDALVFVNVAGQATPLGDYATLIAQNTAQRPTETIVQWPANRGILVQPNPSILLSRVPYRGIIQWTLADVP